VSALTWRMLTSEMRTPVLQRFVNVVNVANVANVANVIFVVITVAIAAAPGRATSCVNPEVPSELAEEIALGSFGPFDGDRVTEIVQHGVAQRGGVWLLGSPFGMTSFGPTSGGCDGNPAGLEFVSENDSLIVVRVPLDAPDGEVFRLCESVSDEWGFDAEDQCACYDLQVLGPSADRRAAPSFELATSTFATGEVRGCGGIQSWDIGVAEIVGPAPSEDLVVQLWMSDGDDDRDIDVAATPIVPAESFAALQGFYLTELGERVIGARMIRLSDGAMSETVTTTLTTTMTKAGCAAAATGELGALVALLGAGAHRRGRSGRARSA
jgi:hypothetical protein